MKDIAAPRFAAAYKTREAALAAKEDITRILLLSYSGEKRATQADDYVRKRTRHDPPHTADWRKCRTAVASLPLRLT